MCTSFPWTTECYQSQRLSGSDVGDAPVQDRQDRVPGFSTRALQASHLSIVGAGGFGSHLACGLARKGVGCLSVVDHDTVEMSNLNRQCFVADDIGHPKALRLASADRSRGRTAPCC